MRKRVFSRIVWFLFLFFAVFVLLVTIQFTRQGNFSHRIGDMLISGYYSLPAEAGEAEGQPDRQPLDGGVSVFFGGLEFRLSHQPETDNGFSLIGPEGERRQVFPENMTVSENTAIFVLPGGTELFFTSSDSAGLQDETPELRISGKFADGISGVDIPFRPQRSSVIRNSSEGMFNISHNGQLYQFSRSLRGLESGQLVLLSAAPAISYQVVTGGRKENNPADFIISQAQTHQAYAEVLSRWTGQNFAQWGQMGSRTNEDMVIAWCTEALRRGNYRTAASTVPASFGSGSGRTWESAVYQFDRRVGVWERAVRAMGILENEKKGRISRLLEEREISLFAENHLVEFMAVRGFGDQIDEIAVFAGSIDPSVITLDTSPGILEAYADMGKWRPNADNPFESLAEQACRLAADGLRRDENSVFVFGGGMPGDGTNNSADTEFNIRLGMALQEWGEKSGKDDWAGLGRSLVLSVISLDDNNGSVPVSLTVGAGGEFAASTEWINTARLYRMLDSSEYSPRAIATGVDGIWAWTAASSVNISRTNTQMDINIRFPSEETHYIMLRNVRPFPLLQIYEANWRRAADFESYYNSSGWYYFEQEQTLVLKIRHRTNVERVRILFTAPSPPPPPPPPPPQEPSQQEQENL